MATVAASVEVPRSGVGAARARRAVVSEWHDVGGVGRLALASLVLSLGATAFLGVWIETSMRRHLLDVRTEMLQATVDEMLAEGELPLGTGAALDVASVSAAIDERIIGGDLVGVAVRDASGRLVFARPDGGEAGDGVIVEHLRHVERHGDGLLHFVLPVEGSTGTVGSVEVLQRARPSEELLSRVRRNLWMSIAATIGSLGTAMGAVTTAHARAVQRRRKDVERLLAEVVRAEDRERQRVVGALHDDVGQPLYRLLYGLEGCRARVDGDATIVCELDHLTSIVRDVDRTLRDELHRLHRSTLEDLDLHSGLRALAEECRAECDLVVTVSADLPLEPTAVVRSVLLRVAEEALVNVRKHANATAVSIDAWEEHGRVRVDIVDDGDGPKGAPALGLTTAAQRLRAIDGDLTYTRGPNGGVLLGMTGPLDRWVDG